MPDDVLEFADTITLDGALRKTADGYMVANARVARTGIQLYRGAEIGRPELGVIRVYRPESEVFDEDAMKSFAHRPVTMGHPDKLVDASTWRRNAVGQTGEKVVRDGQFVQVPMVLMDAASIKAVENGTRQLSMGYTSHLEFVDGVTPEGEKYDAVQRTLRMNHLAIVPFARGGSQLIMGDEGDQSMDNSIKTQTVLVDGLSVITTEQGAQAIAKLQSVIVDAQKALAKAESDHTTALATLDAKVTGLEKALEDEKKKAVTDAALDQRVQQRGDLLAKAKKIVPTFDAAGKTDAEVKKAVVIAKDGADSFAKRTEGKSADYVAIYVDTRFDTFADAKSDPVAEAFKGAAPTFVYADGSNEADKAYQETSAAMQDAWRMQPGKEG